MAFLLLVEQLTGFAMHEIRESGYLALLEFEF